MDHRTRQQRARAAATGIRMLSSEEEARLMSVALPYGIVSLALQSAFVVLAVRTVRKISRTRHLGARQVLPAAGGPLLGLLLLPLAQVAIDRRVRTWVRSVMNNPAA